MQLGFWERTVMVGITLALIGCIVLYHLLTGRSRTRRAATPGDSAEGAGTSAKPSDTSKVA